MLPIQRRGLALATALAALCSTAFAAPATVELPEGATELVEAEATPPKSTSTVFDDDTASGGKAVRSDKQWEPVLETTALAELESKVTLWVRYQGGPVQLKTIDAGKQTDRDWVWGGPDAFAWKKVGTYSSADLGDSIRFIRGDTGETVAVDCIAYDVEETAAAETPQDAGDAGITGDAAGGDDELPPAHPDADATPIDVSLSIDWSTPTHDVPQALWGVSLFGIVAPEQSEKPEYAAFLQELSPSFARVHSAEMTQKWWDAEAEAWNVDAIRRCFEPHREWLSSGDVQLMVCLPYDWPASVRGMETNGKYLPPERYEAGRKNVRDLMTLLVNDLDIPVTHWELTNEWDNTYEELGKLDELWTVIGLLSDEARSATPSVVVGGPAFTWPKPEWIEGLLASPVGQSLSFLSWHGYAAGKPTTPNNVLPVRAARMGEHAAEVAAAVKAHGLGDVPTYKTEFNVQWTWQPYERRHANSVGAAYLAATVTAMAAEGVDGAAVWHAMGNAYGLADAEGRVRATGQLYLWANRYLHGSAAAYSISPAGQSPTTRPAAMAVEMGLAVLPIEHADGTRALLIANQTPTAVRIDTPADDLLPNSGNARLLSVTADGGSVAEVASDLPLVVPGFAVVILTDAAGDAAIGAIDLSAQHLPFKF